MTTNYTYKDFDFNFEMDSIGELGLLEDDDSIKQSIRNIILTSFKERARYQKPRFGSNVYNYLGEKVNSQTAIQISNEIENTLLNFENRIRIIDINASIDFNTLVYKVTIKYNVKNLNVDEEITVNLGIIK